MSRISTLKGCRQLGIFFCALNACMATADDLTMPGQMTRRQAEPPALRWSAELNGIYFPPGKRATSTLLPGANIPYRSAAKIRSSNS